MKPSEYAKRLESWVRVKRRYGAASVVLDADDMDDLCELLGIALPLLEDLEAGLKDAELPCPSLAPENPPQDPTDPFRAVSVGDMMSAYAQKIWERHNVVRDGTCEGVLDVASGRYVARSDGTPATTGNAMYAQGVVVVPLFEDEI